MQAVEHLLRLLIEHLVGHLLPGKAQVAGHRHEPQPDRPALGEMERARIVIALFLAQERGNRLVGEVRRRDHVGDRHAALGADAPALGQVRLDERAMPAP